MMRIINLILFLALLGTGYSQIYPKLICIGSDTLMAFTLNQNKKLIFTNEENKTNKLIISDLERKIRFHDSKDSAQKLELESLKKMYFKQREITLIETEAKKLYKKELSTSQENQQKLEKKLQRQKLVTKFTAIIGGVSTGLMGILYLLK